MYSPHFASHAQTTGFVSPLYEDNEVIHESDYPPPVYHPSLEEVYYAPQRTITLPKNDRNSVMRVDPRTHLYSHLIDDNFPQENRNSCGQEGEVIHLLKYLAKENEDLRAKYDHLVLTVNDLIQNVSQLKKNQNIVTKNIGYEQKKPVLPEIQPQIQPPQVHNTTQNTDLNNRGSPNSKKRPIQWVEPETPTSQLHPPKRCKAILEELLVIRRRIPGKLNSGYVIHSLLCCALNNLGATYVYDTEGNIDGICVTSYWLLKSCCLFITNTILQKRIKTTDHGTWDKSLKQHWFTGWCTQESFLAKSKEDKKEKLNELSEGHEQLTQDERAALLVKVHSLSNKDSE